MRLMRRNHLFSILLVLCSGTAASAQELVEGHGPGVGIEENLGGLTGGAFVYDAGRFRFDVLLEFAHASNVDNNGTDVTDYGLGGRFFYVLHRMERADFSLGGGLAIVREEVSGGGHETNIQIELAAQIRVFLAPNVSLSGALGLGIVTADNQILKQGVVSGSVGDGAYGFGGQLLAGFGIAYYFR